MAAFLINDELIDDSENENPVVGLNGTLSFKDRFKDRFSRLLGRTVAIHEAQDSQTINIYVDATKRGAESAVGYDKRIREFVKDLEGAMRAIARSSDERDEALDEQWDVILEYVSHSIHETITALQQAFEQHQDKFHKVLVQMCGLDDIDEHGSALDTDLGDRIIRLQELTNAYDGTVKQQNELIELAWTLLHDCPAADVRLRCLLGSTFSNKIYELICRLSYPKSTHYTLARAARDFVVFQSVNISLGSPPSSPLSTPRSVSPRSTAPSTAPSSPVHPLYRPSTPVVISKSPQGSLMESIWPYLPKQDRGLDLLRLQPITNQATALLIGCVLHSIPVPPGSDTYYLFGFVACRTDNEVQGLMDYYRQILNTTTKPTIIFSGILKALEHGTVAGLIRNKSRQNFEASFPTVYGFLTAPPEQRFSVHRLVQFIRDTDNDEPLPCLKRDFGFKLCTQRDQVLKLKALYAKVIEKAGPGGLHSACTFGRLLEFAVATLGFVDPQMLRLLQNDYPNSAVGFDNAKGLEMYMAPLFKRSLKG